MVMIPLKEYAIKNGKNPDNARQMALRGSFKTATKFGSFWVVDSEEPWPDRRRKNSTRKK